MNIDNLFDGVDEFEKQEKLSTVDTSNFSEKDKLELEIQEDEVRKHITLLETQRGDRDDEDVDLDIKKARHTLLSKEDELIGKYKPVPTSETKPSEEKILGKLGEASDTFNEFNSNISDEIFAPLKPATDLFTERIKEIGNAIGGTVEDAWNWLANDDVDTYDKLRELNKDEYEKLSKTLDPKKEALLTPQESVGFITEMIPVVKATSSAETFAAIEGFFGYVRGYSDEGDIGEGIKEAGISTAFSLAGGKLAEKFFPRGGEVPSEFAKKIDGLGKDDALAINKVLDNLDANDIKIMDEGARDTLIEQVMTKKGSTDEIAANVKAMLKIQKKDTQKYVSEAYDSANAIARETDAVPTSQVVFDAIKGSSRTKDERKAVKEIKALLKGKHLNAEDMESVLSDLKGLQRSAKNKGKNTYGKAIEQLSDMQKALGGDDIYGEARALSKKFNQDYTGVIKGTGSTAGKQVGKVLEDDTAYQIGEALVGKNVDPNKIGTAVQGLSVGNKMQIVQDVLSKNVDDISTPDGVTKFVQNYNAIDKEGLKVLLGKKTADKLKLNVESIATIESAILDANKIDGGIAREVMDIATAASMASLSPFLAVRSGIFGVKKIWNKKVINQQRFELISRVKEIKDKPLRNKMTKALSVILSPDNMDTFKGTEDFNELVKGIEAEKEVTAEDATIKEIPIEEKSVQDKKSIFSDEDYTDFEDSYIDDKPKQEIEWGRAMDSAGKARYSKAKPSSSLSEGKSANLNEFTKKLEKVESGGKYDAVNKGSGAYGKYQFIPSTLKEYARKTGQTIKEAKTPRGQDKMFAKFTEDNLKGLKRRGLPTTELALWTAHNQGLGGATAIFKGSRLSDKIKRNIASNIPRGMKPTAENYINYWSKKFNA